MTSNQNSYEFWGWTAPPWCIDNIIKFFMMPLVVTQVITIVTWFHCINIKIRLWNWSERNFTQNSGQVQLFEQHNETTFAYSENDTTIKGWMTPHEYLTRVNYLLRRWDSCVCFIGSMSCLCSLISSFRLLWSWTPCTPLLLTINKRPK